MLTPAFQLRLKDPILPGKVTIGLFDGKHACIACATTANKIFIYDPHASIDQPQVQYLSINKPITALAAGRLDAALGRDLLIIGTATHLQVYDVQQNQDIFFREVADGVGAITVGQLPGMDHPLAIVGGNCTILGFDAKGEERFWTVTGDTVGAMAVSEAAWDGTPKLLVGSDDFDIRIFQGEEVIAETSEADRVVGLAPMRGVRFGYALSNGTIGIYDRDVRLWRVKSKHAVGAIASFDLDGDGIPELVSGWSNGRVEVRRDGTGEVMFRDSLASEVVGIVRGDIRGDGTDQLIVCGASGEMRGYVATEGKASAAGWEAEARARAQAELQRRRQELLQELASMEAGGRAAGPGGQRELSSLIPAITKLDAQLEVLRDGAPGCHLVLSTNNDTVIKGVVLFSEQVFEAESSFWCPKQPERRSRMPLHLKRDAAVDVMVKAFVGARTSPIYHVFELELKLPRFAMYASVPPGSLPEPASYATFKVNERAARLLMWMQHSFLHHSRAEQAGEELRAQWLSLRNGAALSITMAATQVTVRTDDMDLAGDIVQDMCAYLGILELPSAADFPAELEAAAAVMAAVGEAATTRMKMSAEMADSSNMVKALVVRAEDSRMLKNMGDMKKAYIQLQILNRELMGEHEKRLANHEGLLEGLRRVNQAIQRGAKLRLGAPKARVVAACRAAVKANNAAALVTAIRSGGGLS